jgi:hypothetical protein
MDIHRFDIQMTIDDSGIKKFISLCKSSNIFKSDIENLLSCSSYERLIELGGPNIGMSSRELWVDIFYSALIENSQNLEAAKYDGLWPREIRKHVMCAKSNIGDIEQFNIKVINEINKGTFIELAKSYVPENITIDKFRINPLVFANNCFGIGSDMILDISFLGAFFEDNISEILAHELHHMLRNYVALEYTVVEKYEGIRQALFWLESEGIANLCNFEVTKELYENSGYAEIGKIEETLENASKYMSKLNDLMLNILNDCEDSSTIVTFLRENVTFHTIGFYMANKIKEVMGTRKIRECVGNPLVFFKYYNDAAKIINKPKDVYIFDSELISKLDRIYIFK